jgi:hypothetical protein
VLDLYSLKCQIDHMVAEQVDRPRQAQVRMEASLAQLERWSADWQALASKIERSNTSWLLPLIAESPRQSYPRPVRPERITVASTDGSQIFPDRHEISSCYLINIGYVLLHYGTGERPLMSSRPTLFHRDRDLYRGRGRRAGVNRELVGIRRSLLELTELAQLAAAAHDEGYPTVAMADGSLIMWSLEGKPPDFRGEYLESMLSAFETLRQRRVPVVGYLSRPGAQDLTNALRLGLCPLDAPDCDHCPYEADSAELSELTELSESTEPAELTEPTGAASTPDIPSPGAAGDLPCGAIDGVGDGALLRRILQPGGRSAVFESSARILAEYGPHAICFFYVHVGAEIARVEVPKWVAEDRTLLDLVHTCVCDQAEKGQGYPVSLSEAHEKAVVRGADRESFYRYLREAFVRHDIDARISNKSLRKRHAVV